MVAQGTTTESVAHYVSNWQMPGFPSMKGMPDLARLLQAQAELLNSLPDTLNELTRATRGLAEAVEASKTTLATVQRVCERIEGVVDDLEDPVRGLRPALEQVTAVLQDPVIERLPQTLTSIEDSVNPIAAGLTRARTRLASWKHLRQRAMTRARTLIADRG